MLTLLAVEDREDIRKLLDVILGDSYRVHLAENGFNAIEILDANEIDIVILDLGLPDLSGFEVLKYIRDERSDLFPYVVILSSFSSTINRTKAYSLGASNFLAKPFDKSELLALLKSYSNTIDMNNFEDRLLHFRDFKVDLVTHNVYLEGQKLFLTSIESKMLLLLIYSFNEGVVSRESFIDQIWKGDKNISFRVVDNHILGLRKKLEISNIEISSIYGKGYLIKP